MSDLEINSLNSQISTVIVLAAGDGKRMKSSLPKVLHEIAGRTLLHHVLEATSDLNVENRVVVVGAGREKVEDHLNQLKDKNLVSGKISSVFQEQRKGTGNAVSIAMDAGNFSGNIMILAGDTPLITKQTLLDFYQDFLDNELDLSVLTVEISDPYGYGRIIRDGKGELLGIREELDASEREKSINEINTGIYCVGSVFLSQALSELRPQNAQGEYYLTDIISLVKSLGGTIGAYCSHDEDEFLGVNDQEQLSLVREIFHERKNQDLMADGVTIIDPTTTWIDSDSEIESGVEIWPGSFIHGKSLIKSGAIIGPRAVIKNSLIESGAKVRESEVNDSEVGENANVGPYSYLRAGTKLAANGKIGAYVETKNAQIGEGSKVPHLTYVGDAQIGKGTNIGAATIFVNYDGEEKHQTVVGDQVRIGSDTMLVAPVTVADGAYTAAGSVITEDVPAGAIGVARARQRNVLGWVFRKRAGSESAKAAKAAGGPES